MTRIGLRNFTCLVPPAAEPVDSSDEWRGEEEPGTTYKPSDPDRRSKTSTGGDFEAVRGGAESERMNCAGSTHMFAWFRAGAINLIAHPAMASMGGPRRGASAVQPVTSLPRSFMEGAAEHQSGDDPTSPVVTCIGQVRVKAAKSAKTAVKAMEGKDTSPPQTRQEKLQKSPASSAPSFPRPSRWKQYLGARGGSVNPAGVQTAPEHHEFQIDLNRFSSACSSFAKTAPSTLSNMKGRTHAGAFLAKSLMMLQLECEEREEREQQHKKEESSAEVCAGSADEGSPGPVVVAPRTGVSEAPLWKRRCGARPLTLDLKKQSTSPRSSVR